MKKPLPFYLKVVLVTLVAFVCYDPSSLMAQCTVCTENEPIDGILDTCETFNSYATNKLLPSTPRWKPWKTGSNFPLIELFDGSPAIKMTKTASSDPNILFGLGSKSSGRYRLSWNMFVHPNKAGYFAVLHSDQTLATGRNNENIAYSVDFNPNGKGYLRIGDQAVNFKQDSFSYAKGAWNHVVQIIDIEQNRVELWINDEFVTYWNFNRGSRSTSKILGSISFWTKEDANYSYYIDNICFWRKSTIPCQSLVLDPVCIKSGVNYLSSRGAGCDLYTNKEYSQGNCERVCDYARKFIEIDAPVLNGSLKNQAIPFSTTQQPCVTEYFGVKNTQQLYSDVFVFKSNFGQRVFAAWKTAPGKKSKAFIFTCECSGQICSQNCLPEADTMKVASTGEHLIKYQIPQAGYYYVVIISDSPIDYTNFYMSLCPLNIGISPDEPEMRSVLESEGCGVCRTITPIPLSCGATYEGDLTGQREKFNKNSEPYDHCTGTSGRDYGGPDAVHKFTIDVPSFVSITLDGKSSLMGMFLYDYACGQHCLDVAENSAQGGTASFAPIFLIPGEYYILVDKELSVGGVSNKYSLTIKCEVSSNQDFVSDESACPKTTTAPHQVRVRSVGALLMNSLSLSLKDRISFVYDKGQQNYVLEKGQFWNGQELVFDFFADNSGDPLKCGYAPGDSFEIRITNEGRVKYVKPVFNTNTNQLYSPGAQSTITDFIQLKENSFFISPNTHRIGFTKGINFEILLQAGNSTSWNISALPNWLSVSQMGGVGPAELLFTTLSDNPSSRIRIATIQITNAENVLRTFFVVQKGCTAASVDLGIDRQVCLGDPVALNAVGTGTFKWSTGSVSSTISVPTNTAGTRSYSITATGTGCTATDTIKVTVKPKPLANAGLDQSICAGSSAILRASGGSSFKWSNNATTSEITVSPTATQSFSVTVTQDGCEATDQVNVTIKPKPVANAGLDQSICSGSSAILRASGGSSFKWSNNATTSEITVSPTTTQNFSVTVTQDGCEAIDQVNVSVKALPVANAGLDQSICAGSSAILRASGGSSFKWSNNATTSEITVTPAATQSFSVTVTQDGCESTDQVNVTLKPKPVADAGLDQSICAGSSAILRASGGSIFKWSNNATTPEISITPTATQSFSVTVTQDGCEATDQVNVTVKALPVANAGLDQSICAGSSAILRASGGSSFKWSNNATTSEITVSPTATQSFSVTVNQDGCEATDQVNVVVKPKPVANAGLDQSICSGSNAILRASGGSSFKWSNNATTSEISVSPAATQNFSVTVTQNGCEATDQVNVKVNPNPIVVKESVNPFTGPFGNIQVRVSGGTPNYKFQWFRNDTLISTQEDLIGLKSGIHKLIVTDVNGCTATFGPELIMATVTSLNDVSNLEQLDIFPNPSNGLLNIKGRLRQSEAMQFTILDALGKRVWASQRMAHKEFNFNPDLSEHAPGLYIIQLEVNGKMLRRKLIIH